MIRLLCLLSLLFWSLPVHAHTVHLSVLKIEQISERDFVTSWERVEGLHDPAAAYLVIKPRFPAQCELNPPRLHCEGKGLVGPVFFDGLSNYSGASLMLKLQWLHAPAQTFTLTGAGAVMLGSAERDASFGQLAAAYMRMGVEHIWLGWDHLAFVLGLLWLVKGRSMLIKTITAFTIAHSLTLSAATLGFKLLPVPPVEAVIALSIAFVAVELVYQERDGRPSWAGRYPWSIAFAFGLLHGFGFASALGETEIARADLTLALVGFNLGVELGQLAFVLVATLLGGLLHKFAQRLASRARPLAHYGMGTLAMYWFIERVLAFSSVSAAW